MHTREQESKPAAPTQKGMSSSESSRRESKRGNPESPSPSHPISLQLHRHHKHISFLCTPRSPMTSAPLRYLSTSPLLTNTLNQCCRPANLPAHVQDPTPALPRRDEKTVNKFCPRRRTLPSKSTFTHPYPIYHATTLPPLTHPIYSPPLASRHGTSYRTVSSSPRRHPIVHTGALTSTCLPRTSTATNPAKRTLPESLMLPLLLLPLGGVAPVAGA